MDNWWVYAFDMDTDFKRAITTGFEYDKENKMTETERPEDDVKLRLDVMRLATRKIDYFETSREFIIYVNDLYKFVKLNWIVAVEE